MKITVSDTTCYVMPSVLSTDASDGNGNHHKKMSGASQYTLQ